MQNKYSLTLKIFIAMALGLLSGILINTFAQDNQFIQSYLVHGLFYVLGGVFVNALKMLVVPLITFSLIVGVCHIGDVNALGRIGIKTLVLFCITTALAVLLALLIAIWIAPGKNLQIPNNAGFAPPEPPALTDTLINFIPYNPFTAFAEGNILQIIFFVVIFAIALILIGDEGRGLTEIFEKLNSVMMKLTDIVMNFAPVGLFFLMAETFSEQGLALILPMLSYCLTVILALALHTFGVLTVFLMIMAKLNPWMFFKKMLPAQFFAFSTASSNATIPINMQILEKSIGVRKSMVALTIPLGATMNMDGTAIMQGVATVFIANVYGIDLNFVDYLTILGIAILASIGTAGVPGVGLMMLTMVLIQVKLPVEGIGIILGVDRLLDMPRTVVNITGDAVVACIVARSENALDDSIFNSELR